MNQTALEAALLPCPFCGDPMELQHTVIRHTEYVADCPISKMSMDSLYRDRWNRRSPAPAPAETEEDRALANFDKIKDSFFASHDVMLSAPAEGVAVRPLEWEEVHQRRSDEDPVTEVVGFEAPDGFGGFYTIVTNVADFTLSHGYDGKDTTHETERSAKAAAETHYQATIRSALLPSESAEKAGVVGARLGGDADWWAESVKLYRRLRAIERAAEAVLAETDKNLGDPFPVKFRAPYGALTKLREALAEQPTIDERRRTALESAAPASPSPATGEA